MTNNQVPDELNASQAINVLIQAVRIGQSKGAFTIEDAELIGKAIKLFNPPADGDTQTDPAMNETPEAPSSTKPIVKKTALKQVKTPTKNKK